MRAETSAPNFWAVSPAQTAAFEKAVLVDGKDCNTVAARPGSVWIAMADVLGSDILPSAVSDARRMPKVPISENRRFPIRLREGNSSSVSEAGKKSAR
jgi:hypothetical protein